MVLPFDGVDEPGKRLVQLLACVHGGGGWYRLEGRAGGSVLRPPSDRNARVWYCRLTRSTSLSNALSNSSHASTVAAVVTACRNAMEAPFCVRHRVAPARNSSWVVATFVLQSPR